MGTIDIRLNGVRETFGVKKKLLGLDLTKQVELLNKLYDGLITFSIINVGNDSLVRTEINEKARNVRILELPEIDNLDPILINITECKELLTLKLPKTVNKIDVNRFSFGTVKNLWIWDTTEITRESIRWSNYNIQLFIRSTTSDKVTVYKNM